MPELVLTRLTARAVECLISDSAGNPVENFQFRPLHAKDQHRVARAAGVHVSQLLAWLQSIRDPAPRGQPKPSITVKVPGPGGDDAGPFELTLRGIHERKNQGRIVSDLDPVKAAEQALKTLDYPAGEPVLEWSGIDRLACLDVDYHRGPDWVPPGARVIAQILDTRPAPAIFHLSHGGGAKLYYAAKDGYTAGELAAVAAVQWATVDGRASVEILPRSRHPCYARGDTPGRTPAEIHWQTQSIDVSALRAWLGRTVDPDAVELILSQQGWTIGTTLPHEHCPISPSPSHGAPVFVGETGVYCHRCAAKGVTLSGRRPGFLSYATMLGTVSTDIRTMVEGFAHWEHAQIVLAERVRLPYPLLRLAYSAILKMFHGPDDPRIRRVFGAGSDMVRQLRRWTTRDGTVTYTSAIAPMLADLPATQILVDGSAKPDPATVARFGQQADLRTNGYPPVTPVAGIKIWGHYLDYPDERILYAVPAAPFRVQDGRWAPRYRHPGDRMADPWNVVERYFPGIDRGYLRLLLVQKGYVEGSAAQAPFVLVKGPTGAGKSTTVHLAASIAGDKCTDVVWTPDVARLRQSIYAGVDAGTYVTVDEVFKGARAARLSEVQALDPVLNLTESSSSHVLYVGPVQLSRLPALVCTDIDVPFAVHADKQLARRFVLVKLSGSRSWSKSLSKHSLQPDLFRLHSDECARSADAIVSEIIDEFFGAPQSWADAVKQCGFQLLSESDEYESANDELRRLFQLVCEAEPEKQRYAESAGWRAIRQSDGGALPELWASITAGANWDDGRRCKEVDWQQLMDAPVPIEFDLAPYRGTTIYVRFRHGPMKAPIAVNQQCLMG